MSTLYEKYNTGDDSSKGFYGALWKCQTFTPSVTHTVTSVKLYMARRNTDSEGTITVSIRATSAGNPTGADLCSGTYDGATLPVQTAWAWITFDLGAGTLLTADTMYAIVWRCPTTGSTEYMIARGDGSSPAYAGGTYGASSNSGSTWATEAFDALFEEWGDAAGGAITKILNEVLDIGENKNKRRTLLRLKNEIVNIKGSSEWTGLGFVTASQANTATFDSMVANMLANGFINLRIDIPDYQNTSLMAQSKAAVIRSIAQGARVTWGVSSNRWNDPTNTITSTTLADFETAILSAAQWAQDNEVFEFQIGNEEEYHVRYDIVAGGLVRLNNVVTVTTPVAHNYDGSHQVTIYCDDKPSFDGTFDITVTGSTTFTYADVGDNEQNAGGALCWDLTGPEIVAFVKSVATDAQAIFTRGNISYSCSYNHIADWITAGRGDLDLLGMNVYRAWGTGNNLNDWEGKIDDFTAAFGNAGYITEFSLNTQGLQYYSADEEVQAAAVTEMIDYFEASGIKRAIFFKYESADFGAWNWNDTYKELWYSLLDGQELFLEGQETVYSLSAFIIKIINEVINLVEAKIKARIRLRVQSEVVNIVETKPYTRGRFKTVSEVLNLSEFANYTRSRIRVVSEVLNIAEVKNWLRSRIKTISEVLNLPEAKNYTRSRLKIISETINIGELFNKLKSIFRSINETVNLSELKNWFRARLVIISETLNITESFNWLRSRVKVIVEVINTSELFNFTRGRFKVIDEVVNTVENTVNKVTSIIVNLIKVISEVVRTSETIIKTRQLFRVVSEVLNISELLARTRIRLKVINEVINISEAKNYLRNILRIIGEAVNLGEVKHYVRNRLKIINEVINLSEIKGYARGRLKVISEVLNIPEASNKLRSLLRVISDAVNVSELKNWLRSRVKIVNETVSIVENIVSKIVTGLVAIIKVITEAVNVSEAFSKLRSLARAVNETLRLDELTAKSRAYLRIINDTVRVVEIKVKASHFIRVISEVINTHEQLIKFVDFIKYIFMAIKRITDFIVLRRNSDITQNIKNINFKVIRTMIFKVKADV